MDDDEIPAVMQVGMIMFGGALLFLLALAGVSFGLGYWLLG